MNWPQLLLLSPLLIAIARVNCYEAECRKWVLGCADARADGSGWKLSCSNADAHRLSPGGEWNNLLEGYEDEFSTWNDCHSFRLHCASDCSEEQIHSTHIIYSTYTGTCAHRWTHVWAQTRTHICTEFTWMCPLLAIWPFLARLHATEMSTESRPDVPSVTCQGERSYLELLRSGNLLIVKAAVPLPFTKVKYVKPPYYP